MKPVRVRVYATSGAYLRRTAGALGESLLRSGPAHQRVQRFIDGYLIRAVRRGDVAEASILDTPAFIMLTGVTDAGNYQTDPEEKGAGLYNATTGPASAFMFLRPMLTVALGRDIALVEPGDGYEPLTAATHTPPLGGLLRGIYRRCD